VNPLSTRTLNRALLARQFLLERQPIDVPGAIEHLVGMQAQSPTAPYVGLWTRLAGFAPTHLSDLYTKRGVVRIALMRSTIHLVTARDCAALRPLVQPAIDRTTFSAGRRRLLGLDFDELASAGRAIVEEAPVTFTDLGARLAPRWPDIDPAALAYAVRALVPLVQVPPRGLWGAGGPPRHTSIEAWLGRAPARRLVRKGLVLRYLAAFGPASVRDAQMWSGLTGLREVFDRLRPRLRVFRGPDGRELFDFPDAPRPDPDTPAPPRFLPEFDNVLLAHADRARIVADRHRPAIYRNGIIAPTLLLDGFARAICAVKRGRKRATLMIRPLDRITRSDRDAAAEEGLRFLEFAAPETDHDVRFVRSIS